MKAIRYHQFGGTDVLQNEEINQPTPAAGEVLIQVAATSFNPVDEHIRLGVLAALIPTELPITPGLDVSGTVAAIGEGVTTVSVGDQVVGMFPMDQHGGAADYAVIAADLVARAPQSVDLADAAALPLTGLAARQAAVELADVRPGQTVLVIGAGGSVGGIVVQLAADAGATVTAAASPRHAGRLLERGATHTVGLLDLEAGPAAVGGIFDVVINHVRFAPEELEKLSAYVADGGIAVSSAGAIPADEARGTRSANVWVTPNGEHLADMVARLDAGSITLNVTNRRALHELPAVHEAAGSGSKTVITVG